MKCRERELYARVSVSVVISVREQGVLSRGLDCLMLVFACWRLSAVCVRCLFVGVISNWLSAFKVL